jgi:hypothetical protein
VYVYYPCVCELNKVGTLFRKVGGGIIGKNKTPTKSTRKESNEVLSEEDEFSDNPDQVPTSPRSSLKSNSTSADLSAKKSVSILPPEPLSLTSIDAISNTGKEIQPSSSGAQVVPQSPKKSKSKKMMKYLFLGATMFLLLASMLYQPEATVEAHIQSLSTLGGDVWWAPLTFKALFLMEVSPPPSLPFFWSNGVSFTLSSVFV